AKEKLKFSEALKDVLNVLASDLIRTSAEAARDSGAQSTEDVRRLPSRIAGMSPEIATQNAQLKQFLIKNLYSNSVITEDRDSSVKCLEQLFQHFMSKRDSMPPDHEEVAAAAPRHVVVCDYIAGMTDQFLLKQYRDHFGALPQAPGS